MFSVFHPDAMDLFTVCSSLEKASHAHWHSGMNNSTKTIILYLLILCYHYYVCFYKSFHLHEVSCVKVVIYVRCTMYMCMYVYMCMYTIHV